MSKLVFGIDLGTTYSSIAVYQHAKAEIVENEFGNRLTPSVVAYTTEERLVGEGARNQAASNPKNTIFASKRLIGRNFDDPIVQKDKENWPFEIFEDSDKIKIRIEYRGKTELIFPEEASAAILERMKKIAEEKFKVIIKNVVISIPAYFNDAQRAATRDATTIAGFENVDFVHEPTAAALAFESENDNLARKVILVYDFGGGTLDVSILEIEENDYTVKAVNGDTHLGGEDFDMNMVDYFVKLFKRVNGRDLEEDQQLMSILKKECEKCKILLSTQTSVTLNLPGTNLSGSITRAKFDHINDDLYERAMALLPTILSDANLSKPQIDEIVMVGGSSRIPKVRKLVSEFFNNKQLNDRVNPDEAIALGAAIRAGKEINLIDVCPLSLSNRIKDGSSSVVIPRNTPIPAKRMETFVTVEDNQESVAFNIYEGERKMAKDNHFLGTFSIHNLPLRPRGEVEFQLTFEIDKYGILKVTAVEPTTGKSNNITISNQSRLSKSDAEILARAAARRRNEDKAHEERLAAFHNLENIVYQKLKEVKKKTDWSSDRKKKAKDEIERYVDWLESNTGAEKTTFENKVTEFEQMFNNL